MLPSKFGDFAECLRPATRIAGFTLLEGPPLGHPVTAPLRSADSCGHGASARLAACAPEPLRDTYEQKKPARERSSGAIRAMLEAASGLPDLLKARREAMEARWKAAMAARMGR
jgi:hypothetical protein